MTAFKTGLGLLAIFLFIAVPAIAIFLAVIAAVLAFIWWAFAVGFWWGVGAIALVIWATAFSLFMEALDK